MRSVARARLLGLAIGVLTAGCGYTFGGNLPPHVKTVAVPVFTNLTQQPAIEGIITAGVVNAFANGGRLRVVPLAQADAVLEGEILSYDVQPIAFNTGITAEVFRLRVTVNVRFKDVRNNTMLWKQDRLEEQSDFRVQGQVSQTISQERGGASTEAAQDIGRKIVSLALDRF